MSHVDLIQRELANLFSVNAESGFVRVVTQCMYPSNGYVQVAVRAGENTFVVSDEGGAIEEIVSAGATLTNPDRMVAPLLRPMGLRISKGVISAPACGPSDIAYSISVVANASRTVADWLFSHARIRPHSNFKEVVSNYLAATFAENVKQEVIVGTSNKPHKFDNVIFLGDRRVIVDAVVHDSSSINAKVVSNLDVKSAGLANVEQKIIYDDTDDWSAQDLSVLAISGASLVRFSQAPKVFERIAANG